MCPSGLETPSAGSSHLNHYLTAPALLCAVIRPLVPPTIGYAAIWILCSDGGD